VGPLSTGLGCRLSSRCYRRPPGQCADLAGLFVVVGRDKLDQRLLRGSSAQELPNPPKITSGEVVAHKTPELVQA
jgi:hypothetical protein